MEGWVSDPYFKERFNFVFKGNTYFFDTAALLFSPYKIDGGTELLLRTLFRQVEKPSSVLNLNCSYGAAGVVLAKLLPKAKILMADKDMLALRYAAHNALLNAVENVSVAAAVGAQEIEPFSNLFDLIIAKLPPKISDRAIEHDFILGTKARLNRGGSFWFVADSSLNRLVPVISRRHKLSIGEVARESGQIVYRINRGN